MPTDVRRQGRVQPSAGAAPAAVEVRAHTARLLASNDFPGSTRRRKLLEYIVDQTLAGRGERLKAYDLALSVLGRGADFAPRRDQIVRLEMAHLRRDLDHYYVNEGGAEPIRITIPKGRYAAVFEKRAGKAEHKAPPPFARPSGSLVRLTSAAAGAGLLLLVAIGVIWLTSW